jgi:hypothetical protein
VISIWGIAHSSVECIPQNRAASDVRYISPQVLEAPSLDLFIEGKVGDARFDQACAIVGIDIEDAIHSPTEVDDHSTPDSRRGASIAI